MPSILRRTLAVLLTSAITALCVYGAVHVGNQAFASDAIVAADVTTSTVHSSAAATTTGQSAAATGQSTAVTTTGQSTAATTTSQAVTTTTQSASTVLVCPRTGCTASSCHATDPSAPGGRG